MGLLFCLTSLTAFAQQEVVVKNENSAQTKDEKKETSNDEKFDQFYADESGTKSEETKPVGNSECGLCRWIDLQTATVFFRL